MRVSLGKRYERNMSYTKLIPTIRHTCEIGIPLKNSHSVSLFRLKVSKTWKSKANKQQCRSLRKISKKILVTLKTELNI